MSDVKVVNQLIQGDNLCDHTWVLAVPSKPPGKVVAVCPSCLKAGPASGSSEESLEEFWKSNALTRNRYIKILCDRIRYASNGPISQADGEAG